jgi:predicted ester cyclase
VGDDPGVTAVRGAVAALNRGDVDTYTAAFTPGALRWVQGVETPFTVGDIRENLVLLAAAFSPLRLDEDLLFGADGHVCARWTLRGVHTGDYWGIAATSRAIEFKTCEVYSFEGSTIVASRVYGDPTALFRQIEASP